MLRFFRQIPAFSIALAFSAFSPARAQFVPVTNTSFEPLIDASMAAWGDMDNDGYLDFAVSGYTVQNPRPYGVIFRYNPSTQNFQAVAGIEARIWGGMAWGDLDNDGDMDLVVSGRNPTQPGDMRTFVYENRGFVSGIYHFVSYDVEFTHLPPVLISGGKQSKISLADFDRDGLLDILMPNVWEPAPGDPNGGPVRRTRIFRNTNYQMGFEERLYGVLPDGADLPSMSAAVTEVGDLDKDGIPDFVIAGWLDNVGNKVVRVYRGIGNFQFELKAELSSHSASITNDHSLALLDYDGDGDLDIHTTNIDQSLLFSNNGNFGFQSVANTGLPNLERPNSNVGDFNNDGRPDLLISGLSGGASVTRLYVNRGASMNPVFQDANAGLPGICVGHALGGDYNRDSKLDILMVGQPWGGNSVSLSVYRNNGPTSKSAPAAPGNVRVYASNFFDYVTYPNIGWSAASAGATPAASLTYNVDARAVGGGYRLVSGNSSTWGHRSVPAPGNAGPMTRLRMNSFVDNNQLISVKVQTVDANHQGSAWSTRDWFVSGNVATYVTPLTTNATYSLPSQGPSDWSHWGESSVTSWNHRSGITARIQNATHIGSVIRVINNTTARFSWTGGTPTGSATSSPNGLEATTVNSGFDIPVTGESTHQTLLLWVSANQCRGDLEAWMEDMPGSLIRETITSNSGRAYYRFEITFRRVPGNTTSRLRVKWYMANNYPGGSSARVGLQAAALVSTPQ